MTSGEVKESVLIKTPDRRQHLHVQRVVGVVVRVSSAKQRTHVQGWSRGSSNSLTPTGPLAGPPSGCAPHRAAGRRRTYGGRARPDDHEFSGQLTLSVDPAWLASLPASAFPINLDPSVFPTPDKSMSFKTDGFTCSNCNIQFGNAVDGGNTFWRTVAHFPYESLFGDEILGAQFNTGWQGGTQNAYQMRVFWASSYSYAGAAGHPAVLAVGQPGGTHRDDLGHGADGADQVVGRQPHLRRRVRLRRYRKRAVHLPELRDEPRDHLQPAADPADRHGLQGGGAVHSGLHRRDHRRHSGLVVEDHSRRPRLLGRCTASSSGGTPPTPSAIHTASNVGPYNSGTAGGWVVGWAANVFADGHNYAWRVQGYDGLKTGPWSGNCTFHVTDPVATSPTSPGFGPATPGLALRLDGSRRPEHRDRGDH